MVDPQVLNGWELNPGASEESVRGAQEALGRRLPGDYIAFLREHDGGEGAVGDRYVVLWKSGELAQFNREYEVQEYAPGLVLFGSNGANEGYGFDARDGAMRVVMIPFIGMDLRHARPMADTFESFLTRLRSAR